MTNIRRYKGKGKTYFVTSVTLGRLPILVENIDFLWRAVDSAKSKSPFELIAWVILPDHFHLLIDPRNHDLSELMRRIKLSFSAHYRKRIGITNGRVWQYRFWDHIIRNGDDMNRHIDYTHYNPVKHGLVLDPSAYPYSSIRAYCETGLYARDWGVKDGIDIVGEFGE